jgi:hypothetical protein
VREAHATDSFRPAKHVEIEQPKTYERRLEVARECCAAVNLNIPQLVDDLQDTVAKAYNALPDRLFILDADGKIAYRGDRGPRGFKVAELEKALAGLLASD